MHKLFFALFLASIVLIFGCVEPGPKACTMEAKMCPDGSAVGRNGSRNCEFDPCPGIKACTEEAKLCPDGSYVGRNASRNCEFNPCPGPKICTADVKDCPDGSSVGRNPNKNCEFYACPVAYGALYGKVTIGPLCPVEPCDADPGSFYANMQVNAYTPEGKLEGRGFVNRSGNYEFPIKPGFYIANVSDRSGNWFGMPGGNLNYELVIREGQKTRLDFDLDTGIR